MEWKCLKNVTCFSGECFYSVWIVLMGIIVTKWGNGAWGPPAVKLKTLKFFWFTYKERSPPVGGLGFFFKKGSFSLSLLNRDGWLCHKIAYFFLSTPIWLKSVSGRMILYWKDRENQNKTTKQTNKNHKTKTKPTQTTKNSQVSYCLWNGMMHVVHKLQSSIFEWSCEVQNFVQVQINLTFFGSRLASG